MRFKCFCMLGDQRPKLGRHRDHNLSVAFQDHGRAIASGLRFEQSTKVHGVSLHRVDRRLGEDTASLGCSLKLGVTALATRRDDEGFARTRRAQRKADRRSAAAARRRPILADCIHEAGQGKVFE